MLTARYLRIAAGGALGSASVLLTCNLAALFRPDSLLVMRALKAAGVALVVPGILAAMVFGNVHSFRIYLAATVNFLFWFAFVWLLGIFVTKLLVLRRALAEVRVK